MRLQIINCDERLIAGCQFHVRMTSTENTISVA